RRPARRRFLGRGDRALAVAGVAGDRRERRRARPRARARAARRRRGAHRDERLQPAGRRRLDPGRLRRRAAAGSAGHSAGGAARDAPLDRSGAQGAVNLLHHVASVAFAALAAWIAALNWRVFWMRFVERRRSPSWTPFLAGIFGAA